MRKYESDRTEISEENLEEYRNRDVISEMLNEIGQVLPSFKEVLINERDAYLAARIRETKGDRIIAIVGAGHVQEGIVQHLRSEQPVDLTKLEVIPNSSGVSKWIGWGIPAIIIGGLMVIGIRKGTAIAGENLLFWILANDIPCSLGALAGLAHPGTIIAAFLAAPITSLTPVIGAGYVTAFVQAWPQPPRVREIHSVADDMSIIKCWWGNRLLKVFLAFLLPGMGKHRRNVDWRCGNRKKRVLTDFSSGKNPL